MASRPPSDYLTFDRESWASATSPPMRLDEHHLVELQGINEALDLDEVAGIYVPLTQLLNPLVADGPAPFIIGLAGSVAVGKSTTARMLQALLSLDSDHPRVDLVATDGFLFPNRELEARGLSNRKGFPESYDVRRLTDFLAELRAGVEVVSAPVYSHERYDIIDGEDNILNRPDVVIVEGLNVLQPGKISAYFDFTIFVDAKTADIEEWFVARFLTLWATVFQDPASFFHGYADLSRADAEAMARLVWREINERNLRDHILPTREQADLILEKGPDHRVSRVRMRRP